MNLKRAFIVGGCGYGKSTLAKQLSKKLKIKNYDLDNIAKIPEKGFEKVSEKIRDKRLKKLLEKKKWIIEGVYSGSWIYPIFKKSEIIIILNIKPGIAKKRILTRYLKRIIKIDKSGKPGKIKDVLRLLKYAKLYPKEYFIKHKTLSKKYKKKTIILENKKQIKQLLKNIK